MSVTSIVIAYGGDEEMAVAALLHDAVEDQGGMKRLREIRRKFGKRVARIVDGCTDSYESRGWPGSMQTPGSSRPRTSFPIRVTF